MQKISYFIRKTHDIVVLAHNDSILQRIYNELWYLHTYNINLNAWILIININFLNLCINTYELYNT